MFVVLNCLITRSAFIAQLDLNKPLDGNADDDAIDLSQIPSSQPTAEEKEHDEGEEKEQKEDDTEEKEDSSSSDSSSSSDGEEEQEQHRHRHGRHASKRARKGDAPSPERCDAVPLPRTAPRLSVSHFLPHGTSIVLPNSCDDQSVLTTLTRWYVLKRRFLFHYSRMFVGAAILKVLHRRAPHAGSLWTKLPQKQPTWLSTQPI